MTGVKNLDRKELLKDKESQINAMKAAFESGDANEVAQKIVENYENNILHFEDMMNQTIREANRANEQQWDASVLASRGVRVLTNDEKKFYNAAIDVQSFDGVSALVPPTVYERVFEDLAIDHPLLSRVNFQRVGATTQWVVRKDGATTAFWGDVCETIKEMVDHGFETIDQGMYKLSGFLVVCKAMFELGPEWLDRYVRAFLSEVIAAELENVIVTGDGNKKPIGMIKDLNGAVVAGAYPDKAKIVLADFTPKTIGEKILAPTTKGGTRRYQGVTLIVNPLDYAAKFFSLGAKRKDDGTWSYDNFSVPGLDIIQTPAVPTDTMIAGNPKDYFMGVAGESKLESTDVLRMIEDQRLYLVRQLANGRPLDADSFTVFDITNTKFDGPADPPPAP
ncbi:phage major capsid protein [Sporosarcina saromensis]|uniref:Phage major capsid protein n=1 Tax=Sporosarcina saromensis TaxID=359365 RepID=A0ABU4G5H8_9BACL|nr:phage major capsid protein [Sporosarcina saromensis]MDW0112212.1 phage major capsid protein [Sporosarcina saromensis]